jgi:hypothetical protein
MTIKRATLYIGGASLLIAWFSSAASVSLQRHPRRVRPVAADDAAFAEVAATVQSRARRLQDRLASASAPHEPARNPFAFKRAEAPPPRARTMAAAVAPVETAPVAPPEPVLNLIGVAEDLEPQGVVRTAMISTAANELILAVVDDVVAGRYKVVAIGADAIELTDSITGTVRRLALER